MTKLESFTKNHRLVTVPLHVDTSVLVKQISVLQELLPEGAPDLINGELANLLNDLVLGQNVMAGGADGCSSFMVTVRFGESFDTFVAALRTRKANDPHGASLIG